MPTPAQQNFINDIEAYADAVHANTFAGPEGHKAGFSMGIYQGGATLHTLGRGYANIEYQGAFNGNTVTAIRSLTKEMTAAVVLDWLETEVQAGTFVGYIAQNTLQHALDLPVAHPVLFPYVKDLVDANPTTQFDTNITFRNLLAQTSGFQRGFANRSWAANSFRTEESLVTLWLKEGYKEFDRGTKCNYSDLSFWVLGLILRKETGKTWGRLLQDIFDDALMTRSFSTYGGDWTPGLSLYGATQRLRVTNAATGYNWRSSALINSLDEPGYDYDITGVQEGYVAEIPSNADVGSTIGSVYSTAEDMCKWYKYLKAGNVCSVNAYNLMNVAQTGLPDSNSPTSNYFYPGYYPNGVNGANYSAGAINWGFGTTIGSPVYGYPIVQDFGAFGGFIASSIHAPSRDAYVVCLANFPWINPTGSALYNYCKGVARRMMEKVVEHGLI